MPEIETYTDDISDAEKRGFFVTLVTVSLVVFDMAFSIGAYGDLFFETYLKIWVAAMVVILGSLALPRNNRPIGTKGIFLMLLPTLYFPASVATTLLVSQPIDETGEASLTDLWMFIILLITALAYVISLPYVVFTLARILDTNLVELPTRRMRISLVVIALAMGVSGFGLGTLHPYWLTCEEFLTAGTYIPANCTPDLFLIKEQAPLSDQSLVPE
jgi:hypothetical protein